MRKLSLILAIGFAVISAPAMAQNVTYACQYIKAGGLNWENKNWKLVEFNIQKPFFLAASNGKLNIDSVAKFWGVLKEDVMCHPPFGNYQTCSSYLGTALSFNFYNMNGGVSALFGASMSDGDNKDSLSVRAFTCTKM
jgi:hypothetical protein